MKVTASFANQVCPNCRTPAITCPRRKEESNSIHMIVGVEDWFSRVK